MVTNSFLLAGALTVGAMAQTTSIMDLFLDTAEDINATMIGSVIHAVTDATTYAVSRLPDANCPWTPTEACGDTFGFTRTYVNGPSTFARHFNHPDGFIWDTECDLLGDHADCMTTLAYPYPTVTPKSGRRPLYPWDTSNVNPVTITAGLEKILALSTATTSGSAQTAPSASSGPSVTSDSASVTSSSSSAPTPSTPANGGPPGAARHVVLAAFGGMVALTLTL